MQLTAKHLKIIAALTMLIDHIGSLLFPSVSIFRIVGRISFPLYAFLIGEGMRKTKNRKKYFLNIFLTLVSFQFVSFFVNKKFSFCVLFGFLLSVLFSFIWEWSKKEWEKRFLFPVIAGFAFFVLTIVLNTDYLFFSFLLPLISYLVEGKWKRIGAFAILLFVLGFCYEFQMFSLFSLLLIGTYSGEKGKGRGKYFFYIFYPLHYTVLGMIKGIMSWL